MNNTENVGFERALELAKQGFAISRKQFKDACYIKAKYPDEDSQNTKPYLQMYKGVDVFPVDLSCESIFAEDWYVVPDFN